MSSRLIGSPKGLRYACLSIGSPQGLRYVLGVALVLVVGCARPEPRSAPRSGYRDWKAYGGSRDNIHYSALDQITRNNVHQLQVAWTYDTGDAFKGSEMECNPIVVNGILFATTPKLRVLALDAATGRLIWRFDPDEGMEVNRKRRNRGLVYWEDGTDRRLYVVARHFLYALDAATGRPVPRFGVDGRIDLREGLGRHPGEITITSTTPGVVYKDLLIMGSSLPEALPSPPGDIRAYELRTGKLRWSFHTIPRPGEFGYDTWPKDAWERTGGANNWSGLTVDEQRGIVYVPTGSAAFDFYGADRVGDNLFANALIALKADTGQRVWHFQFVKHDVWDRDLPAAPILLQVRRDGRLVDAVAQITKTGHVWLFDRDSGKPLDPVEYRDVPASDAEGEVLAKQQPFLLNPAPVSRQTFSEAMVTQRTSEAHKAVMERVKKLRYGGQFVPPSREGTVILPGFDGGGEWGGAAFDPATGIFYMNANEMAWVLRLIDPPDKGPPTAASVYQKMCGACHKKDLRGTPPEFPSLIGLGSRRTDPQIAGMIRQGMGRMPGFPYLTDEAVRALVQYVKARRDAPLPASAVPRTPYELRYTIDGYNRFLDPDGYPAIDPPWGTLNAINLDTGERVWQVPFGEFPALVAKGIRNTGSENYGGPVLTAGGIIFIGATNYDNKFHAFDKDTGKLLWESTLPAAAGNATPAVYEVNGRQFVVIGAGGGKWGNPSGGAYVAFALPIKKDGRSAPSTRER